MAHCFYVDTELGNEQMLINIRRLITALRPNRLAPYRPNSFGLATLPRGLSLVLIFPPKGKQLPNLTLSQMELRGGRG